MALLIGLIGNHDINHLLSQGILILVPNASWVRAVQGLIIHSLLHTHGLSHHDSVHTLLLNPCERNTNKTFYGCSNYPNCDFAAPGLPTGEICKECGAYILKGFKGRKYCMNAECPSRKKK